MGMMVNVCKSERGRAVWSEVASSSGTAGGRTHADFALVCRGRVSHLVRTRRRARSDTYRRTALWEESMGGERETGPVGDDAHSPKGAALHPRNILLRVCNALPSRRARPPASTPPSLSSAHLPFKRARLPWVRDRSTFHPHSASSTTRRPCSPSSPLSSSPSSQVRSFLLSPSFSCLPKTDTHTAPYQASSCSGRRPTRSLRGRSSSSAPREQARRPSLQPFVYLSLPFLSFLNALPFRPSTSHLA